MDSKRFLLLVEEKKKRALEKKEARLKWEQKLEEAAKEKADARARETEGKRSHKKHRKGDSVSSLSDESEGNKEGRSEKRAHRSRKKRDHSFDSSDSSVEIRERKSDKSYGKHRQRSISVDSIDADASEKQRKRRHHRRHKRKHSRKHRKDSSVGTFSDSDYGDLHDDARHSRNHSKKYKMESDAGSSSYSESGGSDDNRRHKRKHSKKQRRDADLGSPSDSEGRKHKRRRAKMHINYELGSDLDSGDKRSGDRTLNDGKSHKKGWHKHAGNRSRFDKHEFSDPEANRQRFKGDKWIVDASGSSERESLDSFDQDQAKV